uniref:AAA family ATPase n=1 Tax=Streptomyces sp. NBC_00003 TaxID=2903608 RepID=A0AAU2UVR9_9ACTN
MGKPPDGKGAPGSAPVGREDEMHTVVEAARRASAGHGMVVLITGEPGIGKTTLVDALAPELARAGLEVCRGAAGVLETRLPFSAIGDCLDLTPRSEHRGRAAVAARIQGDPGGEWQPPAMGHEMGLAQQVVALVEDLCEQGPLALVLDDAQWADSQSLLCLQRISRVAGQLPLLVLLATRSGQSTPELDTLTDSLVAQGAVTVPLRPLSPAETAQLLDQLTGGDPAPELSRRSGDAAGNPFYLTALAATLEATRRHRATTDTKDTFAETDLGSLHEVIMQRLGFLPPEVAALLQAAALLGGRFSVGELAAATAMPPQDLFPRLEMAERAGVLIETGEDLSFQHDLVRQALEERLSVSARQAMHRQLGLALAAAGHRVERVADQLRRSGSTLGEEGLAWLDTAADHLVARDPATAVELLQRALSAADPADPRAERLQVLWAGALLHQSRAQECRQVATDALATVRDPDLRTKLRWILVYNVRAEVFTDALRTLHTEIRLTQEALAHPDTSEAERRKFTAYYASRLTELGDYDQARNVAEGVRATDPEQADGAASQALAVLSVVELCAHHPSKAWELLEHVPGHGFRANHYRASALLDLGRFPEAVAVMRQPFAESAAPETAGHMLWQHVYSAYVQFIGGAWDDARAEVEAGQELAEYGDARRGLYGLGALIALHRGDLPTAETYLLQAPIQSPYTPGDSFSGSFPRWAHARYEQYCGRPAQALHLFEHLCYYDSRDLQAVWLAVLAPEAVSLALETGQSDRAHDLYAFLTDQALHAEPGVFQPALLHCQGLLEDRTDALLAAADQCRALHRPWQEARCHEDTAALLARRDHRADARHELDLAAAGYQRLDAAWGLARVDAALRTLGYRRGVRGPRRRPSHGWDSLTTTELKVAALVAEGLSNPHIASQLFISRSTVQTHVSSILSKLDLTSRIEVAAQATQHTASTT